MPEAKLVAGEEGGLGPAEAGRFILNALRHRTRVEAETADPREAYAPFTLQDCAYGEGWLPE